MAVYWLFVLVLILGLIVLILGAELAGKGIKSTALALGIAPLFISLTMTSVSTSMPELVLSFASVTRDLVGEGLAGFIFANSVSSMIFQSTLSIAIIGTIRSFEFAKRIRVDLKVAVIAALMLAVVSLDGVIGRFEGFVMVVFYGVYLWDIIKDVQKTTGRKPTLEYLVGATSGAMLLFVGIAIMLLSSNFVISGAQEVSRSIGLSDDVVGAITGYGTSMPELFFAVAALFMVMENAAIGTLIGSNSFVLTVPLGLASMIIPQIAHPQMGLYTFGVSTLNYALLKGCRITKIRAFIMGLAVVPFLGMLGI